MPERVIIRTPDNKEFSIDRDLVADRWPGSTILRWEDGRRYAGPQPSETVDADDETDDAEPTDEETEATPAPVIGFNGWGGVLRANDAEIDEPDAPGENRFSPVRHSEDTVAVPDVGEESP